MASHSDRAEMLTKFLQAQDDLVTQSADLSVGSIAEMVKGKAIDVTPPYQRRERWKIDKESALIESFLLNIPVPPVYLAEEEYGAYSVIDGKQRITAMHKFINEGLKLSALEKFKELEGFTFHELPKEMQNALKIRPIVRVITLLKQSSPTLKYEVFTRLNTAGEPLLPQEIRNVAFRGSFNDMIFRLASNSFLQAQLKITSLSSKAYTEMEDAEFVLRFFTLRETWKIFTGNMRIEMDNYMLRHRADSATTIQGLEALFLRTLEICEAIWGGDAFKRPEGNNVRNQVLQGVYDAQMVGIAEHESRFGQILDRRESIRESFRSEYENNPEFSDALRQFTSNPTRLAYRIERMRNIVADCLHAP